jgi:hypothetical protein
LPGDVHELLYYSKESAIMKNTLIVSTLAATLMLAASPVFAAEQQEQIYGSQLMTQQERNEFRAKMRAAKTAEERERIRKEHHERMKERARARGLMLPDEPPDRGSGMRSGKAGTGPGGGDRGR